ncbi:MAG: poly(A) polymerase [Alphaproteobacteria bacterium]|nr:poly(A) polymerase [Alphaproteobacteria bacterium]
MTPAPSRLEAAWLHEGALARLLALLDRDGEEARVVGGAVRNALLGQPPGDIDIATTALPQEVVRRVQAEGFKAVPTGIEHGTVTVVAEGRPFEVTTLREDVETDGRHARVVFGRDWTRDAERRDFTMNALYAGRDGTIHDPVGGLADVAARRVRFIGAAERRIREDYLRILRFFRFHAAYGEGPPDAAGLHACIMERVGLDTLSRERVRTEMLKLVLAPHAVPALAVMAETGLLGMVLGGVPLLASFSNMTKLEAVLALAPDPVRRLGALAVAVAEDAQRLRERLRLANAEYERLAAMAHGWWHVFPSAGEQAARVLLYRLGRERFTDRVLIAWTRASESAADQRWHALATLPARWTAPAFPLRAADFIARGVAKGPALGAALRAAEAAWIAEGFPLSADALEQIATMAMRRPA